MNNIIKRNPLVYIAAMVLLIVIITSATTFGGTYAWFVKTLETLNGVTIDGEMGTVKVNVGSDNRTITNKSNIDIIVRVRVIAEWVPNDDKTPTGVPPSPAPTVSGDSNWTLKGNFLYIADTTSSGLAGYKIITGAIPILPVQTQQYAIKTGTTNTDADYEWKSKVSFIVEALQATNNAYQYTVSHDALNGTTKTPGVTSWALN